MRIFAANAKGKSNVVNLKVSTVKETSRLPLLPPEQSKRVSGLVWVAPFNPRSVSEIYIGGHV